jgi:ABC-type multidrug transport system ATPase subunit/pSer/pThr/pTyr-binding forkhead associated (FHA) protein
MSEWYLKAPNGAQSGPFPTQSIMQWIGAGQVGAEHTVCANGAQQWAPVTEVPIFLQAIVAARAAGGGAPPMAPAPMAYAPPPAPTPLAAPQAQLGPPPAPPPPHAGPQSMAAYQAPPSPPREAYASNPRSSLVPTTGSGRIGGTMAIPALQEAPELAPQAAAPGGGKGRTMLGQMAFGGAEGGAAGVAVIGRAQNVEIVLPYPQVSGRHVGVSPTPDGMLQIVDYGSTNGTHVGGKRIQPNTPVKIKPGDKIFVGPYPIYLGLEGNTVRAWVDSDRTDWSGNLVDIEALDLFLSVPDRENKQTQKVLLNHVTFKAHPGDLIALMGPSGAGKTTLLTVLNGYLRPSSGEVRVNGESLYAIYDALRGSIGYVPQDDIVHPELTVFEAIKYSAQFRLPPDYSADEINRRVEQVIKDLGLEAVKNLEIGKPERKVLSGGQRKRVNIALELVTDPALMFLDEPTSGLAADDTVALIDLLANLAKKYGKTIIVTIHQPAREEYEKFNLALIMGYGGEPLYYGPTGKESYDFFGRFVKAAGTVIDNPRDMFDLLKKREEEAVASGQFQNKGQARMAAAAQWRAEYFDPQNPTYRKMYSGARQPGTPSASRAPTRATVPLFRQFWLLFSRYAIVKRRDTAGTAILLLQAPIIGFLLAMVFFDPTKMPNMWCQQFLQSVEAKALAKGAQLAPGCMQDMTRFTKVADFGGAVFFLAIAALWFGTSNAAREIVSEQAIYRRERMVNLSIFNYVMSKFTLLGILCTVQCWVLLTIVFVALGLGDYGAGAYFTMLTFMVVTATCAASIGLLLSTVVTSSEAAMALTPIALIPQVVLGGRMVPMTNKGWLEYVMALMPSRWSFEGLIAAERTELVSAWKMKACVTTGAGIVDSKFNCALEEVRNVTQGAGGLGFSTYDEPIAALAVLSAMTLVCIASVMILLKRRDSV